MNSSIVMTESGVDHQWRYRCRITRGSGFVHGRVEGGASRSHGSRERAAWVHLCITAVVAGSFQIHGEKQTGRRANNTVSSEMAIIGKCTTMIMYLSTFRRYAHNTVLDVGCRRY